ncbi:MAG: CapA family protein [Calditrichia bacterium]
MQKVIFLTVFVFLTGLRAAMADNGKDIKIVAGGDVMLGSWAQETIMQRGWDYPFRNLDSLLSDADLVFSNLEAPFGKGGTAFEKSYTFEVTPDLVQVLKGGKINMVSLANNHIMDYGPEVLQQTREILKGHQIHFSGAGRNLAEARKPAIIYLNGIKIAVMSCSLTFPEEFWATDTSAGTCFPSHTFFFKDIRKLKKENDLVIVSFHWGSELLEAPKEYQVKLAHRTIDAGADLILGHHPHVVQGIEVYKGKIIAYSLGNFIFGSFSENVRESMLLKFFYGTNSIKGCKIYPIYIYNKDVEFQPRLLTGADKIRFINKLQNLSLELNGQHDVITGDCRIRIN